MKKTIYLLYLLGATCFAQQSWSTGDVELASDYSVKFDYDQNTDKVTMTMVGPDNIWLGVAPGATDVSGMGETGDDCLVYNENGLKDYNMTGSTGRPNEDTTNNWTLAPNGDTTTDGIRTVIASRDRDSGDTNDFVFPNTPETFLVLWAKGGSLSFGFHTGGRGAKMVTADQVLSTQDFQKLDASVTMFPNPSPNSFTISTDKILDNATIEVYDIQGRLVTTNAMKELENITDVSNLSSGNYVVKIKSDQGTASQHLIIK